MRFAKSILFVAVLCLAGGANAVAAKKPPPKLLAQSRPVQDLYYGDVLFYFYQEDYFQALTRVDAALEQQRVPNHFIEAQLLKGGLYLSMGEHVEAGRIFKELLNDNVPDDVRNRAWFYLAKVWYQRGYYSDAELALNSIAGNLQGGLESERRLLHAEVLMAQQRFADAIAVLETFSKKDRFAPYVRFNLGVAMVREQRTDEAYKLLDEVGQMADPTEELSALKDKANLALGFALLKDNQPLLAAEKFRRVRLQGPMSNKALLGVGWADAAQEHYKAALVPWQELRGRNLLDAAVQESYLASPYAYAKLGATRQAAEQYITAIDRFRAEATRIDESIAAIRQGRLLDAILEHDTADNVGWYWQLQQLPDAPETRYLFHLLATHEFQEGLKNYRDLKLMQRNLANWSLSGAAFQDMIDTRRKAFEQRVPAMDAMLATVDLDGMEARKVELGSRLTAIERADDVVGLATSHEAEQWNKTQLIEQALGSADQSDPATEEMREKVRLARGVLLWNMNANFKARLWRAKKEQRELEIAVKEARRRWTLIERARTENPRETEEFAARVNALTPRVAEMQARLSATADRQNQYLAQVAINELQAQKERLAAYGVQAQFALASIYDRAQNEGKPSSEPAPAPPSPDPQSGTDSSTGVDVSPSPVADESHAGGEAP